MDDKALFAKIETCIDDTIITKEISEYFKEPLLEEELNDLIKYVKSSIAAFWVGVLEYTWQNRKAKTPVVLNKASMLPYDNVWAVKRKIPVMCARAELPISDAGIMRLVFEFAHNIVTKATRCPVELPKDFILYAYGNEVYIAKR